MLQIRNDPSLELSHRDSSTEGSQHIVSLRNKKKTVLELTSIPLLSGTLKIDGVVGWCEGAGKTSSAGASY